MEFGKNRLCFLFKRKPIQVVLSGDKGRRGKERGEKGRRGDSERRENGTGGACHSGPLRRNWMSINATRVHPHTCRPTCTHTHVYTPTGTHTFKCTHTTIPTHVDPTAQLHHC